MGGETEERERDSREGEETHTHGQKDRPSERRGMREGDFECVRHCQRDCER